MEGLGLTPPFWRGRRVLLTGHTGFKGAWLAVWLERLGAEVTALALPPEPDSLWPRLAPSPAVRGAFVDIRDATALARHVTAASPEIVLHLAAEAIVRRAARDPARTFAVNVQGTVNLCEALRPVRALKAVVIVTSDKVYAGVPGPAGFAEEAPLGGADPYSASKAACEMVAASYAAEFAARGVPVATARAGNVLGGGDAGEDRLMADVVRAQNSGEPLRLRAPAAVRPWQHVLDPLCGYLLFAERLAAGPADLPRALNFGPDEASCRTVAELLDVACRAWGRRPAVHSGAAEAFEQKPLRLDAARARTALGWRPRLDFEDAVRWTVEWWRALAQGESARALCERQLAAYAQRSA